MLQKYSSSSVQGGQGGSQYDVPSQPGLSPAEHLAAILGFIHRRFFTVLAVLPLTIALAAVYLLTTPPLYEGKTRVLIDTGKIQVFQPTILGEDPQNAAMMDSQVVVLKSESFERSIIDKLHLDQDPEFVGSSSLIGSAIRLLLHPFSGNAENSGSDRTQYILRAFDNRLTVNRLGMTYVIEIVYQSTSPARAAEIANAVADTFIDDQLEARYQTIRRTTTWMQDRLNELRGQVAAADRAAIDYKTKNNIVDTAGRPLNEQELTEVNASLIKGRADLMEDEARFDRLTQILSRANLDPADPQIGAVTDSLHNDIINKLRGQYLDLAQRESIFAARYGQNHLAVVNIRTQMAEIQRSIIDELRQIAEAYKSDADIAKARVDSLQASMAATVAGSQTTSQAAIELRQLVSTAQTYHTLYDNLQQRYTEAVQQQSLPTTEDRVITRALPPLWKSYPKTLTTLGLATIGGLVLGLGLALFQEISDRVFRTAAQVEAELKTECLTLVPIIKPDAEVWSLDIKPDIKPRSDTSHQRAISQNGGILGYIKHAPLSRFAESIRAVKVALDLSNVDKSNKVIGISSSLPNEGKSSIATSLAQLCAYGGARTLLIDCDLRLPSLSQTLAPSAMTGLIEVVSGSADFEKVIWTDPSTGLSFLPVVAKRRLTHTSDILASDAMEQLFGRLREKFDYVIVDLSPLAPVVDVRSTARLIDSYLFVIEWGKTKIGVAEHALSSAQGVYENLLGIVLNKVDTKLLSRYDSSRSDYYYHPHYGRYGYTD
jgi:succinoglycan biosynthesis transport protein ExoP